jgi:hypothetical protein
MAAVRTRALIDELLQALRAESDVLAAGRDDDVAAAAARKADALQRLMQSAGAATADDETRSLLREAQRLNHLNGRIVAVRSALYRARREALLQSVLPNTIYGARGYMDALAVDASHRR